MIMTSRKGPKPSGVGNPAIVAVKARTKIPEFTRLALFVASGGRCEFDGCNKFLLEHHLTLNWKNFAEVAHIVAFSEGGPRGNRDPRPVDINNQDNLMLLCRDCHKEVDEDPDSYPREILEDHKRIHEERIRLLTGLGPDRSTAVLILKSRIKDQKVSIPFRSIVAATLPNYPSCRAPFTIDLTALPDQSPSFTELACEEIRNQVSEFLRTGGQALTTGHVSVFALGRIALLAYLGEQLGNKVPLDLYQHHRSDDGWAWTSGTSPVEYRSECIQDREGENVAILLSLSGEVITADIPQETMQSATIYSLTLKDEKPSLTFLKTPNDLERFRVAYQELLASIVGTHGRLTKVDLFPAVPAPIAILCGRELIPRIHPPIRIWDYSGTQTGFLPTITINQGKSS